MCYTFPYSVDLIFQIEKRFPRPSVSHKSGQFISVPPLRSTFRELQEIFSAIFEHQSCASVGTSVSRLSAKFLHFRLPVANEIYWFQ